MNITNDVIYVGVNDKSIDLFESQYKVPDGMSYNSYVVLDEKIAVMDTVDAAFAQEWLGKIKAALGEKAPDYLIVQHMEPDHSANIDHFMKTYPNCTVVSSAKAFSMMAQFFGDSYDERKIAVKDGDTLNLGSHELTFIMAPMVHWPEVMVTYDKKEKLIFSADAFGKFGANDCESNWTDEARRYYIGIVGKYGAQVQTLLKKVAALEINTVCSLHGPVLTENLGEYIRLYNIWSSYAAEKDGIVIAYSSIYGNTAKAAQLLYEKCAEKGTADIEIFDLARCDKHEAVAAAFKYSNLVLASPTYNGGLFPHMREFIEELKERNYQNRTVGIIENGTWAPTAAKNIKKSFENSKDIAFTETTVTVKSALSAESREAVENLAKELCRQV